MQTGFEYSSLLLPLFSLQPLWCHSTYCSSGKAARVWVVTTSIVQFVCVPSLSMHELLLEITEAAYKQYELSKQQLPILALVLSSQRLDEDTGCFV